MKQVKIDEDLFIMLCKFHLLDLAPDYQADLVLRIRDMLQHKLDCQVRNLESQKRFLNNRSKMFDVFTNDNLPF